MVAMEKFWLCATSRMRRLSLRSATATNGPPRKQMADMIGSRIT
jgi:hypothetical protein